MKKSMFLFGALFAAGLSFTACSSDNDVAENNGSTENGGSNLYFLLVLICLQNPFQQLVLTTMVTRLPMMMDLLQSTQSMMQWSLSLMLQQTILREHTLLPRHGKQVPMAMLLGNQNRLSQRWVVLFQ